VEHVSDQKSRRNQLTSSLHPKNVAFTCGKQMVTWTPASHQVLCLDGVFDGLLQISLPYFQVIFNPVKLLIFFRFSAASKLF
jgi:hypothetical protein